MINPISNNMNLYNLFKQQSQSKYQHLFANTSTTTSSNQNQPVTSQWDNALKTLNTRNKSLYESAYQLKKKDPIIHYDVSDLNLTSSDPNKVEASLLPGAAPTSFTVDVDQVAQAQIVKSNSFTNANSQLGLSGSFSLNGATFSVTDNMSLANIRDLINNANVNINATINGQNELVLTSTIKGTLGEITAIDLSGETTSSSSTDPTVATLDTVLNQNDWSHDITVNNLAGYYRTSTSIDNGFDSGSTSDLIIKNGTWDGSSTGGGYVQKTNSGNALALFDNGDWYSDRVVRTTVAVNGTQGSAGVYLNYIDNANYTRAYFNTSFNQLVLEKSINGVVESASTYYNTSVGTSYQLRAKQDKNGDFSVELMDVYANPLANLSATWTDAKDLRGQSGIFGNNSGEVRFNSVTMAGAKDVWKDASYTVDGHAYTSSTNDNINIGDAIIDLKKAGSTVVSNQRDNRVLTNIGVLNPSGNFAHVVQDAQNTIYSIDGGKQIETSESTIFHNGVQLNLKDVTPTPVKIDVTADTELASSQIISYNSIVNFVKEYNSSVLFASQNQYIQSSYQSALEGTFQRNRSALQSIGIKQDHSGVLTINNTTLRQSINENAERVKSIFLNTNGFGTTAMNVSEQALRHPLAQMTPKSTDTQTTSIGSSINYYY